MVRDRDRDAFTGGLDEARLRVLTRLAPEKLVDGFDAVLHGDFSDAKVVFGEPLKAEDGGLFGKHGELFVLQQDLNRGHLVALHVDVEADRRLHAPLFLVRRTSQRG